MPNLLSKLREKPVKIDLDEKLLVPDFRDIQRIPPDVGIFDEPTRCYRINVQWAKIVMGWVKWLATMSAWVEAENDLYPAIAEILRFTIGEDCLDFQLRQSPTDNCIMEQSLDGGDTWSPVFDFSQCLSIVDGGSDTSIQILNNLQINNFNQSVNNFEENVYNNYVNNYINSITDIAPELGYGDSDDEFRDDALCYALTQFVDLVCESRIEFYQSQIDVGQDLVAKLALAGALIVIVGLAASAVGAPAAAALALTAGTVASSFNLSNAFYTAWYIQGTETVQEQYEDLQAREDVVCCLMSQLESANVDQDDFQNVSSASCGLSANAQAIFDACQIMAGEDATYAAFAENMSIGFQSSKLGLLPACPCAPTSWCRTVDLLTVNGGYVDTTNTANVSIWESGIGWHGSAGSDADQTIISKQFASTITMTTVDVEFRRSSGQDALQIRGNQPAYPAWSASPGFVRNASSLVNISGNLYRATFEVNTDVDDWVIYIEKAGGTSTPQFFVERVTMNGTGENIPDGDIC